jgi:hypothetical protein
MMHETCSFATDYRWLNSRLQPASSWHFRRKFSEESFSRDFAGASTLNATPAMTLNGAEGDEHCDAEELH